jgi:hypothetical protein
MAYTLRHTGLVCALVTLHEPKSVFIATKSQTGANLSSNWPPLDRMQRTRQWAYRSLTCTSPPPIIAPRNAQDMHARTHRQTDTFDESESLSAGCPVCKHVAALSEFRQRHRLSVSRYARLHVLCRVPCAVRLRVLRRRSYTCICIPAAQSVRGIVSILCIYTHIHILLYIHIYIRCT